MRTRVCPTYALPAALLLLAGCQPLNDERTIVAEFGDIQAISYSAPRYQQKLTIQASSPGAPVTVYIVREEDNEAAQRQLTSGKAPAASLAGKEKAEEITLEATVPAKVGYVVLIRADKKKAQVKLKVTGR